MAPAIAVGGGDMPVFEGRITVYVVACVIIAAFGGLMFGYDIGISGFNFFFNPCFSIFFLKKNATYLDS